MHFIRYAFVMMLLTWIYGANYAAAQNTGLAPVIDNDRLRVWDVMRTDAQPEPIKRYDLDTVQIFFNENDVRSNEAFFVNRGAVAGRAPKRSTHAVIIELKDEPGLPVQNTSGLPNAFPRPGAKRLLGNARIAVWGYKWNLGTPTPMHYHDKDAVVIYLEDGTLKRTTPDGRYALNDIKRDEIHYIPRGAKHTELLTKGAQHAIIVELK